MQFFQYTEDGFSMTFKAAKTVFQGPKNAKSSSENPRFIVILHIVPLVEKSRGLSPGGRFPPSFIHQVVIITGLNKLQLYVLALKMALDADRA